MLPVDVMLGRVSTSGDNPKDYPLFVQDLHHSLNDAFILTRKKLYMAHQHQKKGYDKNSTAHAGELSVGDRV